MNTQAKPRLSALLPILVVLILGVFAVDPKIVESAPTTQAVVVPYNSTGIVKAAGTAVGTVVTAPAGAIVGSSDSQTLTNKTIAGASNTLTVRAASDITGTLAVANGGTGQTSFSSGILQSNGTLVSSGTVNLATQVSGTLGASFGGHGWVSAYDQDFTALSLSTASANGAFSIGADSWTVQNFANSSAMSVGGADGLRVKVNANNSTMTPASRTGPCFTTPALTTWITTGDTSQYQLRVSVWLKARTLTNTNDTVDFFIDTSSSNQRYEYDVFNAAGTVSEYMRMLVNNTTRMTGVTIGAVIASHDAFQIELTSLGADYAHLRSGIYSAGFPTAWSHRGNIGAASGAHINPLMRVLSDAHVSLCTESNNTSGTAEAKFGRLKIEYVKN